MTARLEVSFYPYFLSRETFLFYKVILVVVFAVSFLFISVVFFLLLPIESVMGESVKKQGKVLSKQK